MIEMRILGRTISLGDSDNNIEEQKFRTLFDTYLIEDEDGAPLPDEWQPKGLVEMVDHLIEEADSYKDRLHTLEEAMRLVRYEHGDHYVRHLLSQAKTDLNDLREGRR